MVFALAPLNVAMSPAPGMLPPSQLPGVVQMPSVAPVHESFAAPTLPVAKSDAMELARMIARRLRMVGRGWDLAKRDFM